MKKAVCLTDIPTNKPVMDHLKSVSNHVFFAEAIRVLLDRVDALENGKEDPTWMGEFIKKELLRRFDPSKNTRKRKES